MKNCESNKDNLLNLIETLKNIDNLEIELRNKNNDNLRKIDDYTFLLEEIINEYHILSMKIYS